MRGPNQRAEEKVEVAILITFVRSLAGLTKAELAAKAGMDAADVSRWERRERRPGKQNLSRILSAVGVSWELAEALLMLIRILRAQILGRESGEVEVTPAAIVDAILRLMEGLVPALMPGLGIPAAPRSLSLQEEHRLAEERFQRLPRLTTEERKLLVEKSPRFQTWPLVVRLCEASRDDASTPAALEWALLALDAARQVTGVKPAWRERLEGFALAHVALAKVGSDLQEAERDWGRSWELWQKGGKELRDKHLEVAWLLGIEADLLRGQGHLPQSLAKLDQALELVRCEKAKVTLTIARALAS